MTLEVPQFKISGNELETNDEQPGNLEFISLAWQVSKFEIPCKNGYNEQFLNIEFISVAFGVSKYEKSTNNNDIPVIAEKHFLHTSNINNYF